MRKHAKYTYQSQFLEMFGNAKRTPLVDVCLKSGEYGSNSPADDYDGNIRYVRITDITDEGNLNNLLVSPRKIEEKYLLVKDDLLFARTGNTVGKTYLHNEGKMVFAGYLIRYKLNKNIVLPQFAFAYTHTNDYYVWVEKTKKIGAQPNISATQYDEMPIPTPPLSEQKAFVSIAEQADKSKFDGFKSQFLEMFGNPQTCSSGVVGKDVFEFASGKALTKENLNPEYEYNCYGGNGVTGKSNDYLVEASTIVIGRVGEYCGGIHLTNPYSWITDNAIYLKKYDSRYELEFIEYLFKAMDFHRFASESGQPKITQSPLIESVYPLPSKDEQIAFLIIKRQADKSKFELRKAISAIDEVIKSLING